jgi:hypothetical protein
MLVESWLKSQGAVEAATSSGQSRVLVYSYDNCPEYFCDHVGSHGGFGTIIDAAASRMLTPNELSILAVVADVVLMLSGQFMPAGCRHELLRSLAMPQVTLALTAR